MTSRRLLAILLTGAILFALAGPGASPALAGGGAAKCMQIYNHYQMPAAHLVPGDEAKLARYSMFSFNRHRYYDLSPDTYSLVRAINPDIIILNYVHGPGIWTGYSDGDWSMDSENVLNINNISRYSNARGHSMGNLNDDNPDLFLLNFSGERIHTYYKSWRWLLDFGSAEYQAYWLEAVQTDMIDQPWGPDGIYVDNCMPTWGGGYWCEMPAKYATEAGFTAAMHSFQTGIAEGLHALGKKVVPNSGHTTDAAGLAANLAIDADPNYPDFLCEEGAFVHGWAGDATFYPEEKWKRQIDLMVQLQNSGPLMRSHVNIPEGASGVDNFGRAFTYWDALWYAMSSYLLGKNDTLNNAHWTFSNKIDKYFKLYWYDEYHRIDLGVAVGNYKVTNYGGDNIYWREFEKGYVYINPTREDVTGIALPEACKQLSHATINDDPATFADVTSIDLDVHRGTILIKSTAVGAHVAGRYIFYNNSAFDGNDPAANSADDAAIATDKTALLPGGVAGFANYTNFSHGINGIMVDIGNPPASPTAADFEFRVGNDSSPGLWTTLAVTPAVSVRQGAGTNQSDRVTLIFPDGTASGKWLEVTVLATANTGLTSPDVFYFGNAIGETGNSTSDAQVTATDEVAVRNNPATIANNPAGITHTCDFNRDRKVGPTDEVICRNNATNSATALQVITFVENQEPQVSAGPDALVVLPATSAALDGTVTDDGLPLDPGTVTTTWSKLSGAGTVTFDDANTVDTIATFSTTGVYLLQLEAFDGQYTVSDTVEIRSADTTGILFEDNFDDNDISDWAVITGTGWAAAGGEAVKLTDVATPSAIIKGGFSVSSGTITLEFDLTVSGDWRPGNAGLVDAAGNGVFLQCYVGDTYIEIGAKLTDDNGLTGTVGDQTDITADPSTGVTIKYEVNLDTGEVKGYIDGDLKNTIALDLSGVGAITNVVLQAKKNWYLDNLVLRD